MTLAIIFNSGLQMFHRPLHIKRGWFARWQIWIQGDDAILQGQIWFHRSGSLCILEEKSSLIMFFHRRGVCGTIGGAHSWPSNDQYVRIPGTLSKLPQLQGNFGFHTAVHWVTVHCTSSGNCQRMKVSPLLTSQGSWIDGQEERLNNQYFKVHFKLLNLNCWSNIRRT